MQNYDIVSADSHINEPPDLFMNVPKALKELAPKVVSYEKGDAWIMAPGAEPRFVSTSAVAGRKKEEYLKEPVTYANMCKGSFDPAARLKDMDIDHLDADVMYPGIMRYLERCANDEIRLACAHAYNEWMADFCKFNPARLAGIGVVPMLDDNGGKNAVEAIKFAAKKGIRSVFLSQRDGGVPLNHPSTEPFWTAAEELNMPVSIHIHTTPFLRGLKPEQLALMGTKEMGITTVTLCMSEHVGLMMFGGVFMRHPKLKIVFAEGGIGWVPAFLERADHVFRVHKPYLGSTITELPSETWRKQCYATFQEDVAGIRLRDMMGVETLMWASDYPHTDTTWPDSKKIIDKTFAGVPANEKHKMISENAARLYGFKS